MKNTVNNLLRLVTFSAGTSSLPSSWNVVRWRFRRWQRYLGWTGVLAIGIFAISPVFYFFIIIPEQAKLDMAHHSTTTPAEQRVLDTRSSKGRALDTRTQLDAYYRKFPSEVLSPQWLGKLLALAQTCGLSLNDGEYELTHDKVGKLVRYQMTLPVRGEYPQLRKFLTDLPGAIPVIALENVQFERQKVADPYVEAKIKLVLYMESAS